MWLLYNGQEHKVLNELHIRRLIEDGAVEIDDPTVQESLTVQEPLSEEALSSSAPSEDTEQTTGPLESIDDSTEQESQDEAPVIDPSATTQEHSKKSKRSSKA